MKGFASVSQSANSLSVSKTKIETYKTAKKNCSSLDDSPDRKSMTTVASVNVHKTVSAAPQTFTGPHKRSILMDFEPNELSVIEESMVSSHEESTNSAQTTKIEMTGHRGVLAQRSSASGSESVRRSDHSSLIDRACQTNISLSDDLASRDRRKRTTKKPPGLGTSSVSNSREHLDNSFLYRAFSEYGKHLKKRLTFREFEQLFGGDRSGHHVLNDDSFESLLSARLRQMEIEEAKKRRSVFKAMDGTLEGAPFLENDRVDDQEVTSIDHDSDEISNKNRQKAIKNPFNKRGSSSAIMSIARGLEDSLQAAMGTLVNAQASNLSADDVRSAPPSDSRKLSKTSVCSVGSKSDQPKRSLLENLENRKELFVDLLCSYPLHLEAIHDAQGNLLATSIDTVTAVVCDTLQLKNESEANMVMDRRRGSSMADSAATSPSAAASSSSTTPSTPGGICASDDSSSAAGRSSLQSSTIFARWGETLKKRVRRLGSENSSGSGGKAVKTPPACSTSLTSQLPSSRLTSTTDQQQLKLLQPEFFGNSPVRLLDTVALYEPPAIPENWSSPPPRDDYSFTELASARHRRQKNSSSDNNNMTSGSANDENSVFASVLESRGLTAKDMSHSTVV
uniref:Uncharacterized protein n=1 Tax=Romanomermis culicivorax TaxID=13658 RepID=A0A915JST4_ROMCU